MPSVDMNVQYYSLVYVCVCVARVETDQYCTCGVDGCVCTYIMGLIQISVLGVFRVTG